MKVSPVSAIVVSYDTFHTLVSPVSYDGVSDISYVGVSGIVCWCLGHFIRWCLRYRMLVSPSLVALPGRLGRVSWSRLGRASWSRPKVLRADPNETIE